MKALRFEPNVPSELRNIDQPTALNIIKAIQRYAQTGAGDVKPLTGEFKVYLRLRVGDYRIVTVHRVRHRK